MSLGCNLIDTAATYSDGKSEELIGRVLAENPKLDAFIVTKAGYVQSGPTSRADASADVLHDQAQHCLQPDFLRDQLARSMHRLGRQWVDAFLLHNPELYRERLIAEKSESTYRRTIKEAFSFLEDRVFCGTIRYYGVSSNQLAFATLADGEMGLQALLEIAEEVSTSHHFKIVQFPFNLVERDALRCGENGLSLIDLAREANIISIGNRPLNALQSERFIRLATYDVTAIDQAAAHQLWQQCLDSISEQLRTLGLTAEPLRYEVVALLNTRWMYLENLDSVAYLFQEHLYPFLRALFDGHIPRHHVVLFENLRIAAVQFTRKAMSDRAATLKEQFVSDGLIPKNSRESLATLACESYLQSGLNHVLVGMRSKQYVDGLRVLF